MKDIDSYELYITAKRALEAWRKFVEDAVWYAPLAPDDVDLRDELRQWGECWKQIPVDYFLPIPVRLDRTSVETDVREALGAIDRVFKQLTIDVSRGRTSFHEEDPHAKSGAPSAEDSEFDENYLGQPISSRRSQWLRPDSEYAQELLRTLEETLWNLANSEPVLSKRYEVACSRHRSIPKVDICRPLSPFELYRTSENIFSIASSLCGFDDDSDLYIESGLSNHVTRVIQSLLHRLNEINYSGVLASSSQEHCREYEELAVSAAGLLRSFRKIIVELSNGSTSIADCMAEYEAGELLSRPDALEDMHFELAEAMSRMLVTVDVKYGYLEADSPQNAESKWWDEYPFDADEMGKTWVTAQHVCDTLPKLKGRGKLLLDTLVSYRTRGVTKTNKQGYVCGKDDIGMFWIHTSPDGHKNRQPVYLKRDVDREVLRRKKSQKSRKP